MIWTWDDQQWCEVRVANYVQFIIFQPWQVADHRKYAFSLFMFTVTNDKEN